MTMSEACYTDAKRTATWIFLVQNTTINISITQIAKREYEKSVKFEKLCNSSAFY